MEEEERQKLLDELEGNYRFVCLRCHQEVLLSGNQKDCFIYFNQHLRGMCWDCLYETGWAYRPALLEPFWPEDPEDEEGGTSND